MITAHLHLQALDVRRLTARVENLQFSFLFYYFYNYELYWLVRSMRTSMREKEELRGLIEGVLVATTSSLCHLDRLRNCMNTMYGRMTNQSHIS